MLRSDFSRNTFLSLFGFAALVISNFAFSAIAGRLLGAENYSVYNSFFYMLLAFSYPFNSLQLASARYSSSDDRTLFDSIRDLTPTLVFFALLLFISFVAASPMITKLYSLPATYVVWVGAAVLCVWLVLFGTRGIYQGKFRFGHLSFSIGEEGMVRAAVGGGLMALGLGVTGAIGASIVSGITAIFFLISGKRRILVFLFNPKNWKINWNVSLEFLKGALVYLPFGLLMGLDFLMVQTFSGKYYGGLLSACGLFGKNLASLSLVLSNVAFSYVLKKRDNIFWWGLLFSIIPFLAGALFTVFFGKWLLGIFFGPDFVSVASILPGYILACAPLALLQNLVNFGIAKDARPVRYFLWVLLGAIALAYYLAIQFGNLTVFLWTMGLGLLIGALILALLLLPWLYFKERVDRSGI